MVMEDAIRLLRTYLVEVDPSASSFTDDALVQTLADALRVQQAKAVPAIKDLVIDLNVGEFVAEPTEQQGLIIVLKAAATILYGLYRGRLSRGEFGISWQSGLESESSVSAAKSYRDLIDDLSSELEQVVMIANVNFAGTRQQ